MKRFLVVMSVLIVIFTLSGCGCKHEWKLKDGTCDILHCLNCDAEKTVEAVHMWSSGDCENPKSCYVCGLTEGGAPGHQWVEANCDRAKYCKVCEVSDGEPLNHSSYTSEILEQARPGKAGKKKNICNFCGLESEPISYWLKSFVEDGHFVFSGNEYAEIINQTVTTNSDHTIQMQTVQDSVGGCILQVYMDDILRASVLFMVEDKAVSAEDMNTTGVDCVDVYFYGYNEPDFIWIWYSVLYACNVNDGQNLTGFHEFEAELFENATAALVSANEDGDLSDYTGYTATQRDVTYHQMFQYIDGVDICRLIITPAQQDEG